MGDIIHYLTPYSIDRNIGKAYNDAIRSTIADDDDWFVIMDGDIAFLTPEWGRQIHEVAQSTDFALLGCVTGRLRYPAQLLNGKFDSDLDMYQNFEDAKILERDHWGEVEEISAVAGMFMMFRKKTWAKVAEFEENTIKADFMFNHAVRKSGGKIGVIKGLYGFHAYRLWHKTQHQAMNSYQHLISE